MEAGSNFKFGGWLTKQRSLQCSCTERTGYRGGQTAADFLVVISCITNCIYIFLYIVLVVLFIMKYIACFCASFWAFMSSFST